MREDELRPVGTVSSAATVQVLMQMKLTAVRMELRELKRRMPAHRAQASTAGSSTKCAAAEVVKLELLHMLLRLGT